jgi:hypothetical protein
MDLYFGGAEIPGHRTMLAEAGVTHVAFSYMGLRRRTKFSKPWLVAEKFPANQQVFLDSGAYTVNRADEDKYSQRELKEIAAHYMSFVQDNIGSLSMVSEFDAFPLGREWIQAARDDFWDDLPENKFLPIWHGDSGLDDLYALAKKYSRVGVPQVALGDRNLAPVLNSLVSDYGTYLHGVAMTKPAEMAAIRWDSVASTSWISPSQYGDTIVWTGKELKRYPKKYKDQKRKQHRTLFENAGFDPEKIAEDDTNEVLRFTIWSWQQLVADLDRHRGRHVVATLAESSDDANAETTPVAVDTETPETRKSVPTRVRGADERLSLPVLASDVTTTEDDKSAEVPVVRSRGTSMRVCDTCFLKAKCPAFEENTTCAYDIPVEIRTRDQIRAMTEALIEWQFQRVAFMKMAEDLEGGYADPNLSNEMDRLMRLTAKKSEMEQEGFSLKIEAKERGQAGTISRLFGSDAGQQVRALEAPVAVPSAMEQLGILDADVVEL